VNPDGFFDLTWFKAKRPDHHDKALFNSLISNYPTQTPLSGRASHPWLAQYKNKNNSGIKKFKHNN
jgi:hypothetical protein